MQDNDKPINDKIEANNVSPIDNNNKTTDKIKRPTAKKSNADFKRKYFEYYDDIKISDRQDW